MPAPAESARQRDPVPTDSRYECLLKIASGGMATVYVGRLRGRYGFSRLVAIKRAHAHLVDDDTFRRLMIGEARLASRIHHPNVVSVLDVDEPRDELLLVMDYVEGASLSQLLTVTQSTGKPLPLGVTLRILIDVCAGVHAAHELVGERGEPLSIVHRDVSPQNVLVGVDGQSRITDFGVAKWNEATQATAAGWKGKFAYMAPEYVRDRVVDRRSDVFGIGVILWEAIANRRLFRGESGGDTMLLVTKHEPEPIDQVAPSVPKELVPIVKRALEKDPEKRYSTAAELGLALEEAARSAGIDLSPIAVTQTVREIHGADLDARRAVLRGLLTDSGETTAEASDLVAGRPLDGPVTATGAHMVTISDARTLPIQKRASVRPDAPTDRDVATPAAPTPEETHAPVSNVPTPAPRGLSRGRLIAGIVAAAAVSAAVTWGVTNRTASRASSSASPVPTMVAAAAAPAATTANATAAASDTTLAVKSAPHVEPSAPLGLTTHHGPPHAHSAAPHADAGAPPPVPATVATPTSTVATPPSAPTSKPGRPGLGY